MRPGHCLRHGYVERRCCALFEPTPARPFLAPAMKAALPCSECGHPIASHTEVTNDGCMVGDCSCERKEWHER